MNLDELARQAGFFSSEKNGPLASTTIISNQPYYYRVRDDGIVDLLTYEGPHNIATAKYYRFTDKQREEEIILIAAKPKATGEQVILLLSAYPLLFDRR